MAVKETKEYKAGDCKGKKCQDNECKNRKCDEFADRRVKEYVEQIYCEDNKVYEKVKETLPEKHESLGEEKQKEIFAIMRAGANARLSLPSAISGLTEIIISFAALVIAVISISISTIRNEFFVIYLFSGLLIVGALIMFLKFVHGNIRKFDEYQRNSVIYEQIKEIYGKPNKTNKRFIYKCQIVRRSDKRLATDK